MDELHKDTQRDEQNLSSSDEDHDEDVKNQVFNTSSQTSLNIGNKKLFTRVMLVLGVLVAVGAGAYFYFFTPDGQPRFTRPSDLKELTFEQDKRIHPDDYVDTEIIDTSSWKTYRNEEAGFEVKYPNSWFIIFESESKGGSIELSSVPKKEYVHGMGVPDRGGMWFGVAKNICNKPTNDFQFVVVTPGLSTVERVVCLNNFQITLGYTDDYSNPLSHKQTEENKEILESIFSTFKFIEPQSSIDTPDLALSEVEGWQTYRNEEYGFEFRYPAELIPVPAREREIAAQYIQQYVAVSFESNDGIISKSYYGVNKPFFVVFRFPSQYYEKDNVFKKLSTSLEASADEHTTENIRINSGTARVEFYRTGNWRGDEVTLIAEARHLDTVYLFVLSANASFCTYAEEAEREKCVDIVQYLSNSHPSVIKQILSTFKFIE